MPRRTAQGQRNPRLSPGTVEARLRPRVGGNRLGPTVFALPLLGNGIACPTHQRLQLAIVRQNLAQLGLADRIGRMLAMQQRFARSFQAGQAFPIPGLCG